MKISFKLRGVFLAAALLSAAALPSACSPDGAQSQAPSADHASIGELVTSFRAAWESKDFDQMLDVTMPPLLLGELMRLDGIDESQRGNIRKQLVTITSQALKEAKLVELTVDVDSAKIESSSAGRRYATMPVTFVMDMNGQRLRSVGTYLALQDGGRWYLLSLSDASNINSVRAAYPDLAQIPMSPPKLEATSL